MDEVFYNLTDTNCFKVKIQNEAEFITVNSYRCQNLKRGIVLHLKLSACCTCITIVSQIQPITLLLCGVFVAVVIVVVVVVCLIFFSRCRCCRHRPLVLGLTSNSNNLCFCRDCSLLSLFLYHKCPLLIISPVTANCQY